MTYGDEFAKGCNVERAMSAEAAVKAYAAEKEGNTTDYFDFSSEGAQERLADLLADLRHWARLNHLDFGDADRVAGNHFAAEVGEEQGDDQ